MADIVTPQVRSRMMSGIRGADTRPEMAVRRALRNLGVGYRLHVKDLPGRPDIVMKGRRKIVEVMGCYWHRHPGCPKATTPSSNTEFWNRKFASNVARDARNLTELEGSGWSVLRVWECETGDATLLQKRIAQFLGLGECGGRSEGDQGQGSPSREGSAAARS
ncbi:very short patch repair endonuclease [Xanthobacter autotrophicus]|uniref:very short patch repair endonuclease n=1 Tax=Xanthobacter TaxID=279 RepID=UPI0024AB036C|nr:very short patch repair endonuclease [Xanthobacter autotrophicus]MDI4666581.1 very short patch repair endonuclease [Xanthobacter autotrophicus]